MQIFQIIKLEVYNLLNTYAYFFVPLFCWCSKDTLNLLLSNAVLLICQNVVPLGRSERRADIPLSQASFTKFLNFQMNIFDLEEHCEDREALRRLK